MHVRHATGAGAIPGKNGWLTRAADPAGGSGKWLGLPIAEGRKVGRRGRCVVQDEAGALWAWGSGRGVWVLF